MKIYKPDIIIAMIVVAIVALFVSVAADSPQKSEMLIFNFKLSLCLFLSLIILGTSRKEN
jgi:hypothetical protein